MVGQFKQQEIQTKHGGDSFADEYAQELVVSKVQRSFNSGSVGESEVEAILCGYLCDCSCAVPDRCLL